MLFLSPEMHP